MTLLLVHAAATPSAFDQRTHARLVRTNWISTAPWTVRGVLALALLAPA